MIIYTDRFSRVLPIYQVPDNQTVSHSQSIFDQKNDFKFLALFQSRIEYFLLKRIKFQSDK